jgi:hypothetical protein
MDINLGNFGGPVFVGRANGAAVRARLDLDTLDKRGIPVVITVPESTYSVNSSFFLGMFGPSIGYFGSRDAFLRHYPIQAPAHVRNSLEELIERTLASRGPLLVS